MEHQVGWCCCAFDINIFFLLSWPSGEEHRREPAPPGMDPWRVLWKRVLLSIHSITLWHLTHPSLGTDASSLESVSPRLVYANWHPFYLSLHVILLFLFLVRKCKARKGKHQDDDTIGFREDCINTLHLLQKQGLKTWRKEIFKSLMALRRGMKAIRGFPLVLCWEHTKALGFVKTHKLYLFHLSFVDNVSSSSLFFLNKSKD